jgi:hypothetical protein
LRSNNEFDTKGGPSPTFQEQVLQSSGEAQSLRLLHF